MGGAASYEPSKTVSACSREDGHRAAQSQAAATWSWCAGVRHIHRPTGNDHPKKLSYPSLSTFPSRMPAGRIEALLGRARCRPGRDRRVDAVVTRSGPFRATGLRLIKCYVVTRCDYQSRSQGRRIEMPNGPQWNTIAATELSEAGESRLSADCRPPFNSCAEIYNRVYLRQ